MSWYIHPTKQLRDDELPPELVVTNRNGSIEQVYVPYSASDQLQARNDKLRELAGELLDNLMPEICARAWWCDDKDWRKCGDDACGNYAFVTLARELGIEVDG